MVISQIFIALPEGAWAMGFAYLGETAGGGGAVEQTLMAFHASSDKRFPPRLEIRLVIIAELNAGDRGRDRGGFKEEYEFKRSVRSEQRDWPQRGQPNEADLGPPTASRRP